MAKKKRRKHSAEFKAKVALEVVREQQTVEAIARKYKVSATMVHKWKRQLLENLSKIFDTEAGSSSDSSEREAELLKKIGELTIERDFLSKGLGPFR
jgi:transposase-like protein